MVKQLVLPTLIYASISALGFVIINAIFDVEYSDPAMQYLGISFMLVSAGFVAYLLRGRLHLHGWLGTTALPRHYRFTLRVLIVATLILFLAAPIEFALRGEFSPIIFASVVLSLLIGFSEEGFFRKFILDHTKDSDSLKTKCIWLIGSMVLFGFLHMTNVLSGMPLGAAFDQSLKAMPMGLVAGAIYLRTRAFLAVVLWHASIDFTLFANAQKPFYFGGVWGIIIDLCIIALSIFVIWDAIKALRSRS
ncbi:CPBP family intramembrane glutamic endopeptidase [Corynebacterium pelargi]|uniref:CAAX amino terminal protease self-immunity n=1 Tax=Corynebacterium pelargi TaxID=1471400 RepID=A0A410W971_9CORY|nr:CPBP family intramembrane glutamic endopeptidase [Corynebacterium pelargi]QAU52496.1 CAAX amino terminal protease self- immunity [Corynebacterium pelargi]GGG76809.1 hypothetical protein GCM10007338_13240 [Corynebacterium pelargi]